MARVCKLDRHLAPRVRFTHRRGREMLAFRLGGGPASISSHPTQLPSHLFLYNFGSGAVSERVTGRPRLLPATLNPLARSVLTSCTNERTDATTRELTSPPERVRTPLWDRVWVRYMLLLILVATSLAVLLTPPPVLLSVVWVLAAGATCGLLVVLEQRRRHLGIRASALAVGFVIAMAVATPSCSSNDLWSYTMYGRTVTVHHANRTCECRRTIPRIHSSPE